ncbi:putative 60s ribosomal protein l21 protein [Lasiodiplodia theobromae]|uniref:60S ribosomal protein L21-A n=2 Tax=Lasiodiplodia TaxID=66739 RepID=A0A5N5DR76_9PEZI|nr:60s ribosomal protein l21 [Lasiodiplodia theobromae]KAB2580478.1 60S ribosomal protein L21-A [Lasiodiplodia theobromae]KAF4541377.1 60s ribosomal protein l21 [Lasiodiplodia theobromae]KAF9632659.1 putative 60s ribosomal protein l21 protein [Lasiodiplodia theobromae]KAK0661497.1 60S ribosomal protein L21-A [Lasiodiplodia hormozganensis]
MGHSAGLRAGTRYAFSRGFKNHGAIKLSTYLKTYKVGDIVDVVANGAVQKGMPYKVYHGKTGVVYNVTKSAVGVILYKQVGNRYIEKRINVRIEHVRHSRSREEFINRVKENAARRKAAKAEGQSVQLKRQPALPREARTVSTKDNRPETVTPIPYETTI